MRVLAGVLGGLLLGVALTLALSPTYAQGGRVAGIRNINHVGIALDNFEESVSFYTQKLGFREVDRFKNDKGETTIVFVQAGPNTFLELAPSNANRPAGLTHFGVQVDNLGATLAALKERGVMAPDARKVAPDWSLSSVMAPGARMEITELGPQSSLEKATASLK
jgi:catechol 2,3-dioxygenase-like lactoylglutathione lyase family enzyme